MRLKQAINEKIHMCDRIILALTSPPATDHNVAGDELDDMVVFLEDERERLRIEGRMLEDGTHPIFA
jgi:hypothetical protein